jgi:hypothetical protein
MADPQWFPEDEYYEPPCVFTYMSYVDEYVGSTELEVRMYPLVMGGINVIGSTMQGSSGYIEIYGTDLGPWWASNSAVSIQPADIPFGYTYISPSQINISYSIPANASPGTRNLRVTTAAATFAVKAAGCGDERDAIIQEYINYGVNLTPQLLHFQRNAGVSRPCLRGPVSGREV